MINNKNVSIIEKINDKNVSIIEKINDKNMWDEFLNAKIEANNLTSDEVKKIQKFIDEKKYTYYYELITNNKFPKDYPRKLVINKQHTEKKRIVYSYSEEENIIFKFIAFYLSEYDYMFNECCYAFRKKYGVLDAMKKLKRNSSYAKKYGYKADIRNYFNSIDSDILLDRLMFVKEKDVQLYNLFAQILKANKVYDNDALINENCGAMAGIPISPFFANVYLMDLDKYFYENNIDYFRYSDDVLIFANTKEKIEDLSKMFNEYLHENRLYINEEKVAYIPPGDEFEFLGFSYNKGEIDISLNSKKKIMAKIKRKSHALRRWQNKKNLAPDKGVIGFVKAINSIFFGTRDGQCSQEDFSWCRWYYPCITTDKTLREIDEYIQKYIRYTYTGRHYKGNYRISYNMLKQWGYVNLVNRYYNNRQVM